MLRLISAAAANAETELTLGEKLSEGVMTMIIGMGTTFVVLIVLWMLVALMGRIVSSMSGKKAAAIPAPAETKPEPVQEAALPAAPRSGTAAAAEPHRISLKIIEQTLPNRS